MSPDWDDWVTHSTGRAGAFALLQLRTSDPLVSGDLQPQTEPRTAGFGLPALGARTGSSVRMELCWAPPAPASP